MVPLRDKTNNSSQNVTYVSQHDTRTKQVQEVKSSGYDDNGKSVTTVKSKTKRKLRPIYTFNCGHRGQPFRAQGGSMGVSKQSWLLTAAKMKTRWINKQDCAVRVHSQCELLQKYSVVIHQYWIKRFMQAVNNHYEVNLCVCKKSLLHAALITGHGQAKTEHPVCGDVRDRRKGRVSWPPNIS